MQRNDCVISALGPGQYNDLLLQYYLDNGAVSDQIDDAEYEFLEAQGITGSSTPDMWYDFLTGQGYSGTLTDMQYAFWCISGGGIFSFLVIPPDLTDKVSGNPPTIVFDATAVSYDGNTAGANEALFENSGSLLMGGVVDQLIKKSEDISDGVWIKVNSPIVTASTLLGTELGSRVQEIIATTDSVLYNISFTASVATGGQQTGYRFEHDNSESGNRTNIELITEVPKRYNLTVLGKSGGGNVSFGFGDWNSASYAEVTITDFQVTQSSYLLPYLANDSAVATISSALRYTNGTQGVYYDIEGDLLDSFDGVADGVELWSVDSDVLIGSYITETDGVYHINTPGNDTGVRGAYGIVLNGRYQYVINIIEQNAGALKTTDTGTALDTNISGLGEHIFRFTATNGDYFFVGREGATNIKFTVSVKQISDAQGEMVVKWTPKFDYDVAAASFKSVLTVDDDGGSSILYHALDAGYLRMFDGTNVATAASINWSANIPLIITQKWGPHPDFAGASKMFISVTDGTTTWDSSVVDFDGSFNPGDFLSPAYDNEYFQKIDLISIKKEVTW